MTIRRGKHGRTSEGSPWDGRGLDKREKNEGMGRDGTVQEGIGRMKWDGIGQDKIRWGETKTDGTVQDRIKWGETV